MIRTLLAISALIVQTLTPTVDKALESALNASVLIHMKVSYTDRDGEFRHGVGGCSGTWVGENLVLTAAHCVEFNEGVILEHLWVKGPDSTSREAEVLDSNTEHDLALLKVDKPFAHSIAKVNTEPLVLGSKIWAIGCPFDFRFLISEGVISNYNISIKPFKSKYVAHTAMINPGSSGGGLFNSKGELLGVNTLTVGQFGWAGISLAVSAKDIQEFLNATGR